MATSNINITGNTQTAVRSVNSLGTAFNRLAGNAARFGRELGRTLNPVNAVREGAARTERTLHGLNRAWASAVIGIFSGRELIRTRQEFIRLEAILSTVSDSMAEVGTETDFFIGEVQRLGLDLRTATNGFAKLKASAEGTALEGEAINKIFSQFSETLTVYGADALATEGTFRALSQMISKTRVASEELRGQLAEHLPGAFEVAARSMGLTTMELQKMLEKGDLLAVDLLPKLGAEFQKIIAEGLPAALRSPRVALNVFWSNVQLLMNDFMKAFEETFGGIMELLSDFVRWIRAEGAGGFELLAEEGWKLIVAFENFGNAFGSIAGLVIDTASQLVITVVGLFNDLVQWLGTIFNDSTSEVQDWGDFWKYMFTIYIPASIEYTVTAVKNLFIQVGGVLQNTIEMVKFFGNNFSKLLSLAWSNAKLSFKNFANSFLQGFVNWVNKILEYAADMARKIAALFPFFGEGLSQSIGTPSISFGGFDTSALESEIASLEQALEPAAAEFRAKQEEIRSMMQQSTRETLEARDQIYQEYEDRSLARQIEHAEYLEAKNRELSKKNVENFSKANEELGKGTSKAAKEAEKAIEKLKDKFSDLMDELYPNRKIFREYAEDVQTLSWAFKLGLIPSMEEFQEALTLLRNKMDSDLKALDDKLKDSIDIGEEFANTFTSAFEDIIVEGGNMRDAVKAIFDDIKRIVTRVLVTAPLERGIKGFFEKGAGKGISDWISGGIGKIFGFAEGGDFPANRMMLVGEQGPELIMPRQSGTVIPNDRLGAGGNVSVVINNNAPNTIARTNRVSDDEIEVIIEQAKGSIMKDISTGGNRFSQAFESSFSVSRRTY